MATLLIPTDTSQATLGYLLADGSVPLTDDWSTGAFRIDFDATAGFKIGTSPVVEGGALTGFGIGLQVGTGYFPSGIRTGGIFVNDGGGTAVEVIDLRDATNGRLSFGATLTTLADTVLLLDTTGLRTSSTAISDASGAGRIRLGGAGVQGAALLDENSNTRIEAADSSPHAIITGDLDVSNRAAIGGTASISTQYILRVKNTITVGVSGFAGALILSPLFAPSANTSTTFQGIATGVVYNPSATTPSARCVAHDMLLETQLVSGEVLGTLIAMRTRIKESGAGGGQINNAMGLQVRGESFGNTKVLVRKGIEVEAVAVGAGGIDLNIGLDIEDQSGPDISRSILVEGSAVSIHQPDIAFGTTAAPIATVDIHGGFAAATVVKTGDYTATSSDHVILCDASGDAFTIFLPAASGVPRIIYHIKKIDSSGNAVTVDGNASETIDDALTQVINVQYDSIMISCDGSGWHII